jgi:hypothetical protein
LIKLIPHIEDRGDGDEIELSLLTKLPVASILSRRSNLGRLGVELAPDRPWIAVHIVEALGRAGAWGEARKVAEAGTHTFDSTAHNQARGILMTSVGIDVAFEEAIAEGRTQDLPALKREWEENAKRQEELNADVKKRNSRSSFSRPF